MIISKRISRVSSILLILVLNLWSLPVVPQQTPNRDRRVLTTPPQAATPAPTPQSAAPALAYPATTPKTLPELQARVTEILQRPELATAFVGVKVVSLETGRVLVEENAGKLLRPASNMKLYTVAAALDRLSPEYRYSTSVYAQNPPDAEGVVRGDLTIYGRGDPSIAARFNNGDYFKGINDLAAQIVAAGVKRVEGDLIGDETFFTGPQYGSGWTWEDLQWSYGAEVSALSVNDNALDLFVRPGPRVGAPAQITTGPPDPLLTIVNRVTTSAKGSRRELAMHRGLGRDVIEISGSVPIDDRGYAGAIAISHPALLFVYLLRSALAQRGVKIAGRSRTVPPPAISTGFPGRFDSPQPAGQLAPIEIASLQSQPFSAIAAETLKPSQNLYTELILRTLGKLFPPAANDLTSQPPRTSEEAGLEVVKAFLTEAGVQTADLSLNDGSGLSRNDMVTPNATIQLLLHMGRHRFAKAFRDALPIAGIDGTLRNRFRGTLAANNVRAKTGTLSSAASLSGYLKSAAGEDLVFSIIVNNYPRGTDVRTNCIDPITVVLATFAGKS